MEFTFNPSSGSRSLRICLLSDTPNRWIMPWVKRLEAILKKFHTVQVCTDVNQMLPGDIAFFLGCTRLVNKNILDLHPTNLVVHESNLPDGRGFSPVAWQVCQGKNTIPVCLFEAVEKMDAGPIYLRDRIKLDGTELLPEIRIKQGEMTVKLCLKFLEHWPDIHPEPQKGKVTQFRKRNRSDDEILASEPLSNVFNRLRVVDNARYPAWFQFRNRRYKLMIEPLEPEKDPKC